MKVKNKIKLGISILFILMFLLSWLLVSTIAGYKREALLDARFEQLVSLREALASHVKDYQKSTVLAVETIVHDQTVQKALEELAGAYRQIPRQAVNDKSSLEQYYREDYIKHINTKIPDAEPIKDAESYLPEFQRGLFLQQYYILEQQTAIETNTLKGYIQAHQKYHNYLLPLQELHGFNDLFFIDTEGNIVYSVAKEVDFGSNLLTGVYRQSGLADAYRASRNLNGEHLAHAPYKPYEPSYNHPSSFLAMPVYKQGKYIGSVAVQLPIEPINNIMTFNNKIEESGLGKTGEVYIVGRNFTMRNDSRFVEQNTTPLVQELGTTIGVQTVKTQATLEALEGKKGQKIITDYRNQQVLSAYEPLVLFGESAAILAEIDYQTVVANINIAVRDMMVNTLGFMIFLWAVVLLFFNQLFLHPLRKLNHNLQQELLEQEQQVIVNRSLLNEYKKAVDASAIVSKTDKKGNITYINSAFCEVSGYSKDELIGMNHRIVKSQHTPKSVYRDLWGTINQKKIWKGIICNASKNGEVYYVSSTIVPILTIYGDLYEYIAIGTDVTELFLRQEKILLHTTDSLTQLPNRQKFLEELTNNKSPRLAIINIDHFSEINDFYGYHIGDALLIKIAERLLRIKNQGIGVFRLSGDEFGLLSGDELSSRSFENKCVDVIEHLSKESFCIEDNELNIAATMGMAEESNNVYANASMALRVAKESQKRYLFYNSNVDIQERSGENLRWTKSIKDAIECGRIELYIQPIINSSNGRTEKYECLMRLIDEKGQEISPFFFIDIAKHARLYPKLSEIIIKKSFDYFSSRTESFSINLTIIDILNEDIIKLIKQFVLDKTVADRVILEIVESEGIDNFEEVSEFIQDMQALGCRIAIDDFGTGYSNFEYLMKLSPDFIKIDGSIVRNIAHDQGVYAITKLIHDFSSCIGAKTIAEFVCDEEVCLKLNEIGVDYLQGYYYGKPTSTTKASD